LTLYIERRDRYIKIIIRAGLRARGGEEDIGMKKETFILSKRSYAISQELA